MKFSRLFRLLIGNQLKWGVFAGMRYVDEAIGSSYGPKLLGTYEKELSSLLKELCDLPFTKMIDVGAAEGYYAIGFCLHTANVPVVAFESESKGRDLISLMACLNSVKDRVSIMGWCDQNALRDELSCSIKPLLIMDAEGAEVELLDPSKIPELYKTRILVELHDFLSPGISDLIYKRFNTSHSIVAISSSERRVADAPLLFRAFALLLGELGVSRLLKSMDEGRPQAMTWFDMTPLNN